MKLFSDHGPAGVEDVGVFEKRHGVELPLRYRSFILKDNGGAPSPSVFFDSYRDPYPVGLFFAINEIEGQIERMFSGCVSDGIIPIGLSGGGDYYFLDLQGGSIHFWDHETNFEPRFSASDLPMLASDIDKFLAGFEGDEADDPSEIEIIGKSGGPEALAEFLKTNSIEAKNEYGRTVAMEAAKSGNIVLLKKCVELGASLEGALHSAASGYSKQVIDYLLGQGLDINAKNEKGNRPLFYAVMSDEIEEYLMEMGAED